MDKRETVCTLCPRECKVNRIDGKTGFCGVTGENIYLARAALHMWEEPCISGDDGSGTVFFSGCPLRCVYCQNYNIANANTGKAVTKERLSEIFMELQEKGAKNINLVTPTHYTPEIIWAVRDARAKGLRIPIVYNCSGYEKVETLEKLQGIVDIYLTDYKYMDREVAKRYSNAPDYPEVAKKALDEMVRQVRTAEFTEDAIGQIASIGFDPSYGARPLRRAIQSDIEDMLAEKMLDGTIKKGDKITVTFENEKFTVK